MQELLGFDLGELCSGTTWEGLNLHTAMVYFNGQLLVDSSWTIVFGRLGH